MLELSNSLLQRVEPQESVKFDKILLHTGSAEKIFKDTNEILLKAKGLYEVSFVGHILAPQSIDDSNGSSINICKDGDPLDETLMIGYTDTFRNVCAKTVVKSEEGTTKLSIVNNSINPINIGANFVFYIRRIA